MEEEISLENYRDTNEEIQYNRKKDESLTYKQIVLRAIEKCRIEGSKQMIKGTEIFKMIKGQMIPVQLEDQRKVYERCIKQLKLLMIYIFDKEAEKNIGEIDKNIKGAYSLYFKRYLETEEYSSYVEWSMKTRQVHPKSEVGARFLQQMEEYIFEQFEDMYQELLMLFKRKNELSNKRMVGLYEK